ncbi:type IV pilus modification protein PilV [Nitrosococcus wardiae]|uniref:Type IV pilus modification protein PilV n=1 Tax=Nitrosococcus wardiae TaxID=1814290 RepID=A0A4P7C3F4_9GAMM|nr:type IV pilus modification protein PilV [Nitrosococcus wardiae]QBQ56270.1 type IV pilus modification protein PilV [Nitrosococcus wardiae]
MKHYSAPIRLQPHAKGYSLLEVLISVVILSIGLLGLAGLQATGLRNNHSAYLRSQATLLAYDIFDRMRANRTAALNGSYNLAIDATPATPPKDCTAVNCVATELAAYDLNDWIQNLTTALPAGDGQVSQPAAATPSVVTVTVQWDDTRGVGDPKQFSMSTEL